MSAYGELILMITSLVVGVALCALILTPLLRRHFRRVPRRWYDREPW